MEGGGCILAVWVCGVRVLRGGVGVFCGRAVGWVCCGVVIFGGVGGGGFGAGGGRWGVWGVSRVVGWGFSKP